MNSLTSKPVLLVLCSLFLSSAFSPLLADVYYWVVEDRSGQCKTDVSFGVAAMSRDQKVARAKEMESRLGADRRLIMRTALKKDNSVKGMPLNEYVVVINGKALCNDKSERNTYGIGFGSTAKIAEEDAVEALRARNWAWSSKTDGYKVLHKVKLEDLTEIRGS